MANNYFLYAFSTLKMNLILKEISIILTFCTIFTYSLQRQDLASISLQNRHFCSIIFVNFGQFSDPIVASESSQDPTTTTADIRISHVQFNYANFLNQSDDDNDSFNEFFAHEWTFYELQNSFALGTLKFLENFALILVENPANTRDALMSMRDAFSQLFWKKIARPSLDYFVFVNFTPPLYLNVRLLNGYRLDIDGPKPKPVFYFETSSSTYSSSGFVKLINWGGSLQGKRLEIAATDSDHFMSFENLPSGGIRGRGVQYKMLESSASYFNFTYGIHFSVGRGTGSKLENGTWIGTAGDVFNSKADFGLPLGTSLQRQCAIDATTVFEYTRLTFVLQRPNAESRWESLFWPFTPDSWLLIILSFIGIFPLTWYLLRKESIIPQSGKSPVHSLLYLLEIFLEQSNKWITIQGLSSTLRFLGVLWIFGSLLLGTAYKSKLVSFLTFPFVQQVPETFSQLAHSAYSIKFKFYGGVAYNTFKTSTIPVYRKLFVKFQIEKDTQICLESVVINKHTVCVIYIEAAEFMISKNYTLLSSTSIDFLVKAKEFGLLVPLVWAFPKGSPLTRLFSDLLVQFQATGLTNHWLKQDINERKLESERHLRLKSASSNQETSKNQNNNGAIVRDKIITFYYDLMIKSKPLKILNFIGPFGLIFIGLVLSLVTFCIEYISFSKIFIKFKTERKGSGSHEALSFKYY